MESQSDNSVKKRQFQKALCGRCGYMLALKCNKEVSIKNGELYFYFYGGMLSVICRGCAATNLIIDEEYEQNHKDKVGSLLSRVNVIRAEFDEWKSRKEKEVEKHTSFVKKQNTQVVGEKANVQ